LYHALLKDIEYAHDSTAGIRFQTIPFADIDPAIEAGRIDAAITKSSYGAYAKKTWNDYSIFPMEYHGRGRLLPRGYGPMRVPFIGQKEKANETE